MLEWKDLSCPGPQEVDRMKVLIGGLLQGGFKGTLKVLKAAKRVSRRGGHLLVSRESGGFEKGLLEGGLKKGFEKGGLLVSREGKGGLTP